MDNEAIGAADEIRRLREYIAEQAEIHAQTREELLRVQAENVALRGDALRVRSDDAWIQTLHGNAFDFEELLAGVRQPLQIDDIVRPLAQQCRFTGQCAFHYSVAQHSLLVGVISHQRALDLGLGEDAARRCERWGLMHDATEAYLSDLSRPLKLFLRKHTDVYDRLEDACEQQIIERFGLVVDDDTRSLVKSVDIDLLYWENTALRPGSSPRQWTTGGRPAGRQQVIVQTSIDDVIVMFSSRLSFLEIGVS